MCERNSGIATVVVLSAILGLLVCGCGHGGPTAPDTSWMNGPIQSAENTHAGNRMLWGLWQFTVNFQNKSMSIVPLREGMAHVNVVPMLEPNPLTFLSIDDTTLSVNSA